MKLKIATLLAAGVISFAVCPVCAGPAFTIEQVMSAPFASTLTTAPVGARFAWVENEQGRRNIWTASAPDFTAHKITSFDQDDGQDIADLAWAPDGSFLLFTRGGDFENGGENPNPNLAVQKPDQSIWRVDFSGSAPVKLFTGRAPQISPKGDIVVFLREDQVFSLPTDQLKSDKRQAAALIEQKGKQADLRWSPDGHAFAFVSEREDHSFIAVYHLDSKSLTYLDPSVDRDSEPVWSPDSTHIAFLRIPASEHPAFFSAQRDGPPWSIRVADPNTGVGHETFRAEKGAGSLFHKIDGNQQLFWSSSDRHIFPWEKNGWCHLYSLPVSGGTPTELTPGEGEVENVAASADRKSIYYSTNIGDIDRRHLAAVPADENVKTKPLTEGQSIEWSPQPAADGTVTAFLRSSYNQRSHVAVRSVKNDVQDLGPSAPSDFPSQLLVKPQPVLITAADGLVIHGQLFLPPNGTGRHPGLIFFHGGSRRQMLLGFHYMYYYSNAYALNQYLASQGYVVLSVNYRSGIGYGLNFREAINYGARGGSEFNDVIGAGLFMKSRPDVDPSQIGVWGGSYGGYLTAMALSRASDLFAAGVDFHGVHDWSLRSHLTSGATSGNPQEVRDRQEAARIAFESSPMASVDTWRSPVLLIHGDDDRNVDFGQTVILVEALRKRNVPMEELIFPNEIHDFLLHRHWVEAYSATADFFGRRFSALSAKTGSSSPDSTSR
jgi:dipeptidyl aminopeptidase/acylaminoacyl peptidase